MSEPVRPYSAKSAASYNRKTVPKLLAGGPIPCGALGAYSGLSSDVGSRTFAEAVFDFQQAESLGTPDGKLGPQTWRALLAKYETVAADENYIVLNGRRIPLPERASYVCVNFDEKKDEVPRGTSIPDLHPAGHFSKRREPIQSIAIHWGGLDPEHLEAVMSSPSRAVSTHFGIGLVPGCEDVVVYQYLDMGHKAWHAGAFNEGTIGFDICQQPSYKWIGEYQKRGYDVKKVENKTSRGPKSVISLDPRIAQATLEFVEDLVGALGLSTKVPKSHNVEDVSGCGVFGHHHVSEKKWDIACWWSDIFDGSDFEI